jgi:ABC-type lipoprotein release transport system permease subunit
MAGYRDDNLGEPRNASRLMAIFGALALVLASVGLYAVVAFAVEQRKREIGIRVALGALQRDVVRLFVRGGARVVGTGLVVGLVIASVVSRLLGSMLFGVTAAGRRQCGGARECVDVGFARRGVDSVATSRQSGSRDGPSKRVTRSSP